MPDTPPATAPAPTPATVLRFLFSTNTPPMDFDTALKIGECALDCADFGWMEGMRTLSGLRIGNAQGTQLRVCWPGFGDIPDGIAEAPMVPDVRDPATVGCLREVAILAWNGARLWAVYDDQTERWRIYWSGATHGGIAGEGRWLGEAWVRALETAAPVCEVTP